MWKKLFIKITNWLNVFQKYEYFYFCVLTSKIFSYQKTDYKKKVLQCIETDLKKHNKKIQDVDFYTDFSSYESTLIISTKNISTTLPIIPLMYETYAYIKKDKNLNVFTYKYQELNIKINIEEKETQVTIYKFKIKC